MALQYEMTMARPSLAMIHLDAAIRTITALHPTDPIAPVMQRVKIEVPRWCFQCTFAIAAAGGPQSVGPYARGAVRELHVWRVVPS